MHYSNTVLLSISLNIQLLFWALVFTLFVTSDCIIYNQNVNTAIKLSLANPTSIIRRWPEKQTLSNPATMEWSQ